MDLDFDNMTNEQLSQAEASIGAEPAPAQTSTEGASEQAVQTAGEAGQLAPTAAQDTPTDAPQAGSQEQTAPSQDSQQEQQPDRRVPVSEHIEMRRRAQAAEQQLAQLQAQQQQAQQQQRYASEEAEYHRLLGEYGAEAANAYAAQVNDRRQAEASQAYAEAQRQEREGLVNQHIGIAERYAVERYGADEYNRQVQKVIDKLGVQAVVQMAHERAARGENPAEWAYQLGRSMITPEEAAAQNKTEIERQVQEALKKYNPNPQTPGGGGVHTIPASGSSPAIGDPSQMTNEELAAAIAARG